MTYYVWAIVIFLLASIIIGVLTILAWRKRESPAGLAFFFLMLCAFIWSCGAMLEMLPYSIGMRIFLANLQFIGITFLPLAELYLVLVYTGRQPSRRLLLIASTIPILTNLVIWTNPFHHWFRGQPYFIETIGPFPVLNYDYQFWFYGIHAPTGYLYLLIAIALTIQAIVKNPAIYRRQMVLYLIALLIPAVTDLLYVAGYSPIPHFNLTPTTFGLSGVILAWNLYGFHFLDLLPLGRDFVFDNLEEGIIILDNRKQILDINIAACRMGQIGMDVIGKRLPEISGPLPERLQEMLRFNLTALDIEVDQDSRMVYYELKITSIHKKNRNVGQMISIRDMTERTELFNRVRELAIHDSLTGTFTRRHFLELLKHPLNYIERNPSYQITILLLDIDHFKQINDTFGHEGGDQAIIAMTKTCQMHIRPMDVLCRWGGDEFAILLEDINFEESLRAADRICQGIASIRIETPAGVIQMTSSLGMATSSDFAAGELNAQNLFRLADKALYYAKELGRNRIATARNLTHTH